MDSSGSVFVIWDFTNSKDEGMLLVGANDPDKPVKIINVFFGEQAKELCRKLIERKE